ncbi:MAG: hypothetical protein ACK559_05285, partial [bacterium]
MHRGVGVVAVGGGPGVAPDGQVARVDLSGGVAMAVAVGVLVEDRIARRVHRGVEVVGAAVAVRGGVAGVADLRRGGVPGAGGVGAVGVVADVARGRVA